MKDWNWIFYLTIISSLHLRCEVKHSDVDHFLQILQNMRLGVTKYYFKNFLHIQEICYNKFYAQFRYCKIFLSQLSRRDNYTLHDQEP